MRRRSQYVPVLVLFGVLSVIFLVFRLQLQAKGFDTNLLLGGNLLLVAITLISMSLLSGGLGAASTQGFLRAVYGGFMFKFFIVAIAVFGYAYLTDGKINKPSVFTLMGLYLLYTFTETRALLKLTKEKKNG